MFTHLLLFLIASIVLSKSAIFLVKEASHISKTLGLTTFTAGFIVMSLATSLPDMFVGISSALNQQPVLSLGNVLGSSILKLTLIVGLGALLAKGVKIQERVAQSDVFYMNLSATAPIIMLWDGVLSRIEGLVLLLIFTYHILKLLVEQQKYTKEYDLNGITKNEKAIGVARFLTGCAFLVGSSELLVTSAGSLAEDLRIPLVLIGIFAVAFGTSLPELSFQILSLVKKHNGVAFGSILGSVVTNSTLVLGLTALISPIVIRQTSIFVLCSFFLIGVLAIFTAFLRSERKLTWNEGLGLILLYIIFMIVELSIER